MELVCTFKCFELYQIPYRCNFNNLKFTVMVLTQPIPNIHVIGIYRVSIENLRYNFSVNSCSYSSSQLSINRTYNSNCTAWGFQY